MSKIIKAIIIALMLVGIVFTVINLVSVDTNATIFPGTNSSNATGTLQSNGLCQAPALNC